VFSKNTGHEINFVIHIKRLCKIVFDEMHALSAHAWGYLPALQTVFESVGLAYLYHVNDFSKERFNANTCLQFHLYKNHNLQSTIYFLYN
jgi:hypothetical protein